MRIVCQAFVGSARVCFGDGGLRKTCSGGSALFNRALPFRENPCDVYVNVSSEFWRCRVTVSIHDFDYSDDLVMPNSEPKSI